MKEKIREVLEKYEEAYVIKIGGEDEYYMQFGGKYSGKYGYIDAVNRLHYGDIVNDIMEAIEDEYYQGEGYEDS